MHPKSTLIERVCPVCGATFHITQHIASIGKGKTCSKACTYRYRETRTPEDRFWEKVSKAGPDDCWLWTASTNNQGYGIFSFTRIRSGVFRQVLAHRLSYQWAYGDIPEGQFICHACDTPLCVNPSHLFAGTALDNAQDMMSKNRHGSVVSPEKLARGEDSGNVVLTADDVISIRAQYKNGDTTMKELAAHYGVTTQAIWLVVHRHNWKHVA